MTDEPRDPELETLLGVHADQVRESMFGALPGVITSYNASKQTASVQPSILRAYVDEEGERQTPNLAIINDVPVCYIGGSTQFVKYPIAAGTPVLIIWCGMSLNQWKAQGGTSIDPLNDGRHDYNDCVCIPGCVDAGHASESSAPIEFDGTYVYVGGPTLAQPTIMASTYRTAESVLMTAVATLTTALSTYVAAIQPTADPTGTVSTTMEAACTALVTAITAFASGSSGYLTTKAKVV